MNIALMIMCRPHMPLPQMPLPQLVIGIIAAFFHSCMVLHGTTAVLQLAMMVIGVQHQLIGMDIIMTGWIAVNIATEKDACVNPYIIFETELWSDLAHVSSVKNPQTTIFFAYRIHAYKPPFIQNSNKLPLFCSNSPLLGLFWQILEKFQ